LIIHVGAGQSYPHLVFALEFLLPRLKAQGFLPFPFVINNELRLGRECIYSSQTGDWLLTPSPSYKHQLAALIRESDVFIAVISRLSAVSPKCHDEIDQTNLQKKKLLPVQVQDGFNKAALHEALPGRISQTDKFYSNTIDSEQRQDRPAE
jgi:hypothetical protein